MPLPSLLLTLGLLTSPASAASRLTLALDEPVMVVIDGAMVSTTMGGQKAVLSAMQPGPHPVEIRSPEGKPLYVGRLDMPDNSEVTARFTRGIGLTVTGGGAHAQETTAPSATFVAGGTPTNTARSAEATPSAGSPAGTGKTTVSAVRDTVGSAALVAGTVVAPVSTFVATNVVPGAASSVGSMVRNADAGGLDAIRGGPTAFRQGRPIPPKVPTGYVEMVSARGEPALVFLEGFLIADMRNGAKRKVQLEVGRHLIEIWDGETQLVRWKGVVEIQKNTAFQLVFTDEIAPYSPDRSWAWSER